MADPFVAEIRMLAFNFAPTGWAFCNGQILPLSQNTALYSLVGTTYGGDGKSTFALPDLQGSAALDWGQGQGLSNYALGEQSGVEAVTLLVSEIPVHTHQLSGVNDPADVQLPDPTQSLAAANGANLYGPATNLSPMAFQALPPAGGSLPHNNMMPYLTLNFCIALQGVYPARS